MHSVTRPRRLAPLGRLAAEFVVIAGMAISLHAQSPDTSLFRRNPTSTFGLPGLVQVPSAGMTPQGTVEFTLDNARQPYELGYVTRQFNGHVTIGFLSWLTISARGTEAEDTTANPVTRDESVGFQVRLIAEHGSVPAIAIGAQDLLGAAPHFESRYVVASKTWFGNSTVSVGYGIAPKILHGVFGGIDVGLGPWATALGEFDGHAVNGGVRLFPFPSLADRLAVQPRIDVLWRQGVGSAVGVGLRTMIGGTGEALPRPAPAHSPATAAPTPVTGVAPKPSTLGSDMRPATSPAGIAEAQRRLIALGLENVRVAITSGASGPVIDVDYENRRYNRDELDALGIVMGVAALHAPQGVQRMRVTIRRVDLPVMTVESDIGAFVAFVNGRLPDSTFAGQLTFVGTPRDAAADGAQASRANSSRWKVDLFLRPRVETQQLNEIGVANARVTALADVYVQLGPGLVLNARRGTTVAETWQFADAIAEPNTDRLLLHQAFAIPSGWPSPLAGAITQFSAGRFGNDEVGFSNETDLSLADGRVSLGSTVAVFGGTFGSMDHTMALGTMRVRFPRWDITTSLTAGRFLHGDVGTLTELARQFGSTDLAFYLMQTDFKSQLGVRLELPLTPARELAPSLLRLRAPDVYTQSTQQTVFSSVHIDRVDVARLLDTDHEIARVYRSRDQLQPVTVLAHVATLREASRRWLGADIWPR